MHDDLGGPLAETITLQQAKKLIQCMAHEQSFLLLAPPGVGKSDIVYQAAPEAGLPCRSLLGTQIAPEDVSGVPRIVGERIGVLSAARAAARERRSRSACSSTSCPPARRTCRRRSTRCCSSGGWASTRCPQGTWVVAAGNRVQDRALVRDDELARWSTA